MWARSYSLGDPVDAIPRRAADRPSDAPSHLLTIVEQFWHREPGGTATATEQTLRALADNTEFRITGLAARHSPPDSDDERSWQRMPAGSVLRLHRLPRPVLYEAWLRLGLPSIDHELEADSVVWASSMVVPPTSRPVVATVHDLDFLDNPDRVSRRGRKFFPLAWNRARHRAQLLVCPSEVVAEDCVRHGADPDRLAVVPWGVRDPVGSRNQWDDILQDLALTPGFVLWVGPLSKRKNAERAARALARLDAPVVAVTVGPDDPAAASAWAILGGRLRRLTGVDGITLSALYDAASVLFFPSLAEGFGLPIAEAMAHGTPVVTSNVGAGAEIGESAALLVDPLSEDDMVDGLRAVLGDSELRRRLTDDGLVRAGQLSWKGTAEGYAAAFRLVH